MWARTKELIYTVIGLAGALCEAIFVCVVIVIMCAIEVVVLLMMLPFGILACIYKIGEICYRKITHKEMSEIDDV